MSRSLDNATISAYARDWSVWWTQERAPSVPGRPDEIRDRDWLMREVYNLTYMDEFDLFVDCVDDTLGSGPKADFHAAIL